MTQSMRPVSASVAAEAGECSLQLNRARRQPFANVVGAATMNMLNAIHALGYGGFWATGADSYEAHLHDALGFAPNERLLGFLFVGMPKTPGQAPTRPARADHVREWLPPCPV
jgi:nitroreductase